MAEMTEKCANPHCHCPAGRDTGYCSQYCKTATEETETGCQCGHPECRLLHPEIEGAVY